MNKKLLLILLVALVLRLISLNQSLWLDEGIQWWAVTTFPLEHLITEYIKGDFNPPLFHIIIYFWVKVFGDSEISLRLPSVIFGLATVWFTYKIAKLFESKSKFSIFNLPRRQAGFQFSIPEVAALLSATAPLLVYYSQEARMYSLAAFTATATLYFLLRLRQKRNWRLVTCYLVLVTSMLYSHYLPWLLIPLLLILQPLLTGIALLGLIPWLPILWQQLHQGLGAATNITWASLSSLSLKNILLVPVKFLIGRLPIEANLFYALLLLLPLCLIAYLLIKSLIAKPKSLVAILYAWFFLPLTLGAIISLKIPVFSYFRFLFVLPAFYLLLTLGISNLSSRLRASAFMFFIVLNLASSIYYLVSPDFHRENWRAAVNYIHQQEAPVIIYSAVSSPFEYYDRGQSLRISETTLDEVIGQPAVWYIAYAQPIFDPENKVSHTLKDLGFQEIITRHFRGVTVIQYKNLNYHYFSAPPINRNKS